MTGWVGFWILLVGVGGLFMLGRYTALFDYMNLVPVVGSSRIPVRYHLWVALGAAILAAVGVDRLARTDLAPVRLRGSVGFAAVLIGLSLVIVISRYVPVWTEGRRWNTPEYQEHFRWLGRELAIAVAPDIGSRRPGLGPGCCGDPVVEASVASGARGVLTRLDHA